MKVNKQYHFLLFCLLVTALSYSCKREKYPVPYVPVDKQINITLPSYSSLQGIGGWVYLEGGSRGIIVYRKNLDEFTVLDRHSTYNSDNECAGVEVDSTNNLILIDPCSDARFSIVDGSITAGQAVFSLLQYNSHFDGTSLLHIYN